MLKDFNYLALFIVTTLILGCHNSPTLKPVSLEQKIGQMLMVGFNGFSVVDSSHIKKDIADYHLGGIILFDYNVPFQSSNRNIENPDQVKALNRQLAELSSIPPFIAIDQEGGRVARLKPQRGFPHHRSAQYLGEIDNIDSTTYYASSQAKLLQDLGFNVNFAPVVDVNTNPDNPVIGQLERSFSSNPDKVVEHASIFMDQLEDHQILSVIKHFPGHGSAWNDSHVGMADVSNTWDESELIPYSSLVQSDRSFGVMTAHVFNNHLDDQDPATLSYAVQTELLRNQIGFDGILFSDDMQMEAIRSFYGLEISIEKAINAGVDILVFGNNSIYDPQIVPKSVQIIKDLINQGRITEERIEESYQRIINTKEELFEMDIQ